MSGTSPTCVACRASANPPATCRRCPHQQSLKADQPSASSLRTGQINPSAFKANSPSLFYILLIGVVLIVCLLTVFGMLFSQFGGSSGSMLAEADPTRSVLAVAPSGTAEASSSSLVAKTPSTAPTNVPAVSTSGPPTPTVAPTAIAMETPTPQILSVGSMYKDGDWEITVTDAFREQAPWFPKPSMTTKPWDYLAKGIWQVAFARITNRGAHASYMSKFGWTAVDSSGKKYELSILYRQLCAYYGLSLPTDLLEPGKAKTIGVIFDVDVKADAITLNLPVGKGMVVLPKK